MAPRFSVITVVLNNISGLRATGESLGSQTFHDREWIVIDGGSTDGSLEYLRNLGANWISERDRGIYDAMNKGMDRSAGEYLLFMNAGDEFADESVLARLAREIYDLPEEESRPGLVYGDALDYEVDRPSVLLYRKARSERKIWYGLFARHQSMLFRRGALGGIRYNYGYRIAGDYEFVVRFLTQKRVACLYVPHPICKFRRGGASYVNWREGLREMNRVRAEFFNFGRTRVIALSCVQGPLAYLQAHKVPLYDWLRTRRYARTSPPSGLGAPSAGRRGVDATE